MGGVVSFGYCTRKNRYTGPEKGWEELYRKNRYTGFDKRWEELSALGTVPARIYIFRCAVLDPVTYIHFSVSMKMASKLPSN